MYGQFEFNFAEAFNYDHCVMQNLLTAFYDRAVGVRYLGVRAPRPIGCVSDESPYFSSVFFGTLCDSPLEHKTCDILAAERLRLMRFDNRLIIDSFQEAICILKW